MELPPQSIALFLSSTILFYNFEHEQNTGFHTIPPLFNISGNTFLFRIRNDKTNGEMYIECNYPYLKGF